jgi:peptide/nickel transport system substrate-binding protein
MALGNQQAGRIRPRAALLVALVAVSCGGSDRVRVSRRPADPVAPSRPETGARVAAAPARQLPAIPDEPPPRPPAGGTLRVHLEAEPPHLDPLLDGQQVIDQVVSGLVYETLVECREGRYVAGLAESWETSSDGLRLQLRLRNGARWHDDRPLTAVDVQASIESLLRAGSRQTALRALLADVQSVEVLPERVVRLRLARVSGLPLRALCEVPILPAQLLRGGSSSLAQLGRQPIGTGPFRFASWEHGRHIRLVRRGPPGPGPPFLDEISFEIDNDAARALARTRRGEIDVLPRLLEAHYPDQVAAGALRETLQLYRLEPERYSFLAVNHHHSLLAQAGVRRALALLWNRGRLAEEVHHGLARPISAPPFAAIPPLPFDPPAARRLLDAAGHVDSNGDGIRDRAGVPIRLTYLQPSGARGAAAEARVFAADLRRAGILLDLVTVDPTALLARLKHGDFDLAPLLWEGRRDDDPAALFGAELAFTGYRYPALQPLFEQLRRADGPPGRAPVLQHIAEALAAEQPVIFLYRHDVAALVARRVHGLCGEGDRLDLRAVWVDR